MYLKVVNMPMRKLFIILIIGFTISNYNSSSLKIQASSEIWPVNFNGQTYGRDYRLMLEKPNLILAINDMGIIGYVKESDLSASDVDSLDDVIMHLQTTSSKQKSIPLYASDGTTIIGKFNLN